MLRAAVAFVSCAVCACAQSPSAAVVGAFLRAGDNRDQLELAWQKAPAEQREAMEFLLTHMPADDARTLTAAFLQRGIEQAVAVRAQVAWGARLADDLFRSYVVPYAQANETREDWRTGFVERFVPLVRDCRTPGEAAQKLNETIFGLLNVHYSTARARADQAPSESIAQGKASCTGLAILLADACRACCVPARLVSVRWPHKPGNHTWVEVWDGDAWRFAGADEPDPAGLDRGWFVGDAARCSAADRAHRIWAVSFAATGERFAAGWAPGIELWGTDVSARYARRPESDGAAAIAAQDPARPATPAAAPDEALRAQIDRFFAADAERRATFEFDRNLDAELLTGAGDARLRAVVFAAFRAAETTVLQADFAAKVVRAGGKESAYTVKPVGKRPASGWPLVIAMHGGGGVAKAVNDQQWRHMQVYYRDQPDAGGYLYCALRAPTDEWNGFYTDYCYPLVEKLIRQFVVCGDVDPDRVIAIGYSHGGYGAFALGPKLPHRFAAVHASAAAPTDGESSPIGLHSLPFSFMVGGRDTDYGRRERCEKFESLLVGLRQVHPGRYPTTFTLVEGNGHTGLPDRDLLAQLVPRVRTPQPTILFWEATDGVVRDHYWLHVPAPRRGLRIDALIGGGKLIATLAGAERAEAWLDARCCDLQREFDVECNTKTRKVTPAPSLRVLCTTMALRGDPQLAASWIVPLP
ncbi:MAG: transglutaminase domain-containing protein [Planctomycetota bacterium]